MVSLFLLAGFVASALFAVLIIPNILLISYKRRLFDIPDSRKVHKVPVPRLGGLSFLPVILISFCLVTAFYYYYIGTPLNGFSAEKVLCDFLSLTVGSMLLYLVGVRDDLIGVGYRYKFIVQIFAAILLIWPGGWLNSLGGLFGIHALPADRRHRRSGLRPKLHILSRFRHPIRHQRRVPLRALGLLNPWRFSPVLVLQRLRQCPARPQTFHG